MNCFWCVRFYWQSKCSFALRSVEMCRIYQMFSIGYSTISIAAYPARAPGLMRSMHTFCFLWNCIRSLWRPVDVLCVCVYAYSITFWFCIVRKYEYAMWLSFLFADDLCIGFTFRSFHSLVNLVDLFSFRINDGHHIAWQFLFFFHRKSIQTRSNGWWWADIVRNLGHMPKGNVY